MLGQKSGDFLLFFLENMQLFSHKISWPLKSAGDMARQKQTKEALGEVVDAVVEEVKVR